MGRPEKLVKIGSGILFVAGEKAVPQAQRAVGIAAKLRPVEAGTAKAPLGSFPFLAGVEDEDIAFLQLVFLVAFPDEDFAAEGVDKLKAVPDPLGIDPLPIGRKEPAVDAGKRKRMIALNGYHIHSFLVSWAPLIGRHKHKLPTFYLLYAKILYTIMIIYLVPKIKGKCGDCWKKCDKIRCQKLAEENQDKNPEKKAI